MGPNMPGNCSKGVLSSGILLELSFRAFVLKGPRWSPACLFYSCEVDRRELLLDDTRATEKKEGELESFLSPVYLTGGATRRGWHSLASPLTLPCLLITYLDFMSSRQSYLRKCDSCLQQDTAVLS